MPFIEIPVRRSCSHPFGPLAAGRFFPYARKETKGAPGEPSEWFPGTPPPGQGGACGPLHWIFPGTYVDLRRTGETQTEYSCVRTTAIACRIFSTPQRLSPLKGGGRGTVDRSLHGYDRYRFFFPSTECLQTPQGFLPGEKWYIIQYLMERGYRFGGVFGDPADDRLLHRPP